MPRHMLHAENTVRLLECQDEVRIGPYSERMKSTEGACEKLPEDDNKGTQKKMDIERKSDGWIPTGALDNQGQHEMQKQEKIPTGALGSLNEVLPESNPVLSQTVDLETVQNINPPFASVHDSKVEEEKDPSISSNADEDNIETSSTSFLVNRNESDEDFFTSKDFIGPIYKPPKSNKQDKSGNYNEWNAEGDENELHENRCKRKEMKKMQAVSATAPEIDDELDQFYKEIHQLENENLDTNVQEKEIEVSQEQHSPFNSSQSSQENYQPILLGNPQPFYENGQCCLGEQNNQKTNNEQQLVVETGGWKTENTFNGQRPTRFGEINPFSSCDGVVLSTDDYFRQQYGYTYNAAQLGDAHEWNRKRAKQAMEQGKSPVIIDNTNTQAWEMKPYVEVALEKGYRVEFHEPNTWWKFDPEELEKRNKHGVTREKIAQMLERYEYQISIPIVMNSMAPPHKSTQRLPLQRRHRVRQANPLTRRVGDNFKQEPWIPVNKSKAEEKEKKKQNNEKGFR
ncbi:hypothetical protein IHE44_0005439 [Lamprotornis superbus]|uniref:NEDD4-binding protein 2-like 2 n=1 Tax=Lamprotornis superbus TaxID=245042 RepID=A0A835TXM8_9PASS|nr:hypothetical protein IHE44_0005439 [Lamprotornis superbus]